MDMNIEKEGAQAVIETLGDFAELVPENLAGLIPENLAELIPEKIDETETDFQLTLRAGVIVPFNNIDLDLGWQFYRTYVKGEGQQCSRGRRHSEVRFLSDWNPFGGAHRDSSDGRVLPRVSRQSSCLILFSQLED